MKMTISIDNQNHTVDLSKPADLSIPLTNSDENPRAWHQNQPVIEPVKMGDWIGKVSEGASINFNNIAFSPHAHGTHTENYGHISEEFISVNDSLKNFFFLAKLISVTPEEIGNEKVITMNSIPSDFKNSTPESLIIRTLPNDISKKSKLWTGSDWPYLSEEAAHCLKDFGIKHLLIDLPSVDKEHDGGKLAAHKAFWNYPDAPRKEATITEMIYVSDAVEDGLYLLNLQVAPFENDASPSRPVIYPLIKT